MTKNDVVVIGAGLSGLATAALLAKQGKRVVVLEKGNQPGGRAYTYEEKGFTLNYGPHAVYRPESGFLGELMARLGRPVPKCGYPDPIRSFWSDGERFASLGAKPHQLLGTKLFPLRTRLALARFLLKVRSEHPDRLGDMTWREWVESRTRSLPVRRFALALGALNTYSRPSGDLSAAFLLAALQRNMFAKDYAGYMYGGWRMMYEAFADVLAGNGGSIVTGAAVEAVEIDGVRAVAAITSGDRYEADAFVCTLPPQDAAAIAPAASALAREMAPWAALEDVRALCIDLGFSRKLRDDLSFVFDIERDLYYSLHSESAPDLAPAGGQLLHAMAYLSAEEAADEALRSRRHEELTAGLDRFFPGWRDAAVVQRTLPNARVVVARQTTENRARRVPLRAASVANLYFAGDGRDLPWNLSELCLASAMEVADMLALAPAAAGDVPAVA